MTQPRRQRRALDYPLEGLRLLGRYHFLTSRQLLALDFAASTGSATTIMLRNMQDKPPFCGKQNYQPCPKRGGRHAIYFLTKRGANRVIDELNIDPRQVSYPKGKPPLLSDYFHRLATIDFHIITDLFAQKNELELSFFHTYFDKTGSNRSPNPAKRLRSVCKLQIADDYLIPDCLFLLQGATIGQRLFAAEIYNGFDTRRVVQQLYKHTILIERGTITEHYQLKIGWQVLSIFETEQAMQATIKRLAKMKEFDGYQALFGFATLDHIRDDFATGWVDMFGKKLAIA